jgi:hypothetical protein
MRFRQLFSQGARDNALGSIYATVAVAVAVGLAYWFWPILAPAWAWITATTDVYRWHFWMWVALALSGWGIILLYWAISAADETTPEHYAYVKDHFFGVQWFWPWPLEITSLICRCPRCSPQLMPEPTILATPAGGISGVSLKCPCGYQTERPGTTYELLTAVLVEIDKNVHDGTWRLRLPTQRNPSPAR